MQRIRQRKYGRDGNSPHALQATHVIKIGFDGRELLTEDKRGPHPKPGKLRGFLLCRDTIDEANQLVVDLECMSKFGVTREAIAKAKQLQLKAPGGLLPTEMYFLLAHDARKASGRWTYPGTFGEEYETWGKLGRFCHGDGVEASRRQEDGTRTLIECVPKGKADAPANTWCPFSVKGECRAKSRLVLCLWHKDQKSGRPMPVSDAFGWEARFRFDTSSEYSPVRFLSALDDAAERLHGNIAGIPGTLSFALQRKRTGIESAPVGIVGQVMLSLSEHEISKREREQWERQLEERKVYALAPGQQALPEHESPAAEREAGEEEEEVVVVQEYGGDFVMPEDAKPVGESPFVGEPDLQADEPAPERPIADDVAAPTDLRAQVTRAHEILLRDFPNAGNPLGFELNSEWGVERVEDVPEEYLADLLALLRNIYKEERKGTQR